MTKPVLYSYWRSSCSWRARIALNLKGVDYEYKTINLLKPEELNASEFVAVNPLKKVPALVVDGHPLVESLAIIEYLEEAYPNVNPLLPKDLVKRAQARAIALHVAAGIQPVQNLRILKYLNAEEAGKGTKWANHWVTEGLQALEALVARSAGKYCVGDEVTIADLCLPSILYNAKRFNVDTSVFTTLNRVNDELSKIEAFKKAEPDQQPDANLNA